MEIIPIEKMKIERGLIEKVRQALEHFPELEGKRIIVGFDGYHRGSASLSDYIINLSKRPKYFTIGHELVHLIQYHLGTIPKGEVQCDIFTIARHELFLDLQPSYFQWSDKVDWETYKLDIHRICREGIELRHSNRKYIYWIREEIEMLASGDG